MNKIVNAADRLVREFGYVIDHASENPRALVLGENHMDTRYCPAQLQAIRDVAPEVVVHEFARNLIFDFENKKIYENPRYKDSEKARKIGWHDLIWMYKMREPFIEEWAEQNGWEILLPSYKIGELAMDFNSKGKFDSLILNIPECVKRIVGCDYSDSQKYALFGDERAGNLSSIHANKKDHNHREKRFARVIAEQARISPVVAFMGSSHTASDSSLHPGLAKKGIEYLCISEPREEGE